MWDMLNIIQWFHSSRDSNQGESNQGVGEIIQGVGDNDQGEIIQSVGEISQGVRESHQGERPEGKGCIQGERSEGKGSCCGEDPESQSEQRRMQRHKHQLWWLEKGRTL